MSIQIIQGDSREQLPLLAADSIDAVITDPPYALVSITKRWSGDGPPPREGVYRRSTAGFMGKAWDTGETAFDPAFWSEVLRVMKPGAHLIAFGGTRTYHRLVCAIEDAGFEIRDQLAWIFGSGFPKSHDVSKGIDKAAGAEREDKFEGSFERRAGPTGNKKCDACGKWLVSGSPCKCPRPQDQAQTESARQWQGWGSALKPAWETICLARKPLTERPLCDTIGSKLTELEGALWSMLSAKDAERLFGLSRSAFAEATSASARWIAAEGFNTRAALSGQMDTSPSELAMISSLNTVWSWLRTWAELCSVESMSTTETGSSTTIDWQTLSYCLSRITPEGIIQDHKVGHGPIASACPAARLFSAELSRLGAILELSAQGPATSQDRQSFLGAGVNLEPIVLARKPLGSPAIDVRGIVEQQLRERGVEGEIRWTKESASGAAKRETLRTSSLTAAPPAVETSAAHAAENGTASAGKKTGKRSVKPAESGPQTTASEHERYVSAPTESSAIKSLMPTAEAAPVAGSASAGSSLSTTSTGEEPPTENNITRKSTHSLGDRGIQAATESFAGIATGLSGLMERVLIKRLGSQSFAWPDDLPEYVPSRSLTIAANVLKHGTGALNIDACRVEGEQRQTTPSGMDRLNAANAAQGYRPAAYQKGAVPAPDANLGRWPANVIHDGSPEVLAGFPDQSSGGTPATRNGDKFRSVYGAFNGAEVESGIGSSAGSAARFFYTPKADKADRCLSKHPTVKPIDLMAYLIKLVTPPGGTVLDPFAGSGSTGMAAMREGFNAILIEREAEYVADIQRRLDHVHGHDTPLFAEIAS